MIKNLLLHYASYSAFQRDLEANEINDNSIVFVADDEHPCIYTHGKEYLGHIKQETPSVGSSQINGKTLEFKNAAGDTIFSLTIDGENITAKDSNGNEVSASYKLKEDDSISGSYVTVDNFNTYVSNHNSAFESLIGDINTALNGLSSDIAIESNTRDAAVQQLTTKLNDEISQRTTDITNLQTALKKLSEVDPDTPGLYVTKTYISELIDNINESLDIILGIIDQRYVLKKDVYKPEDLTRWSDSDPINIKIGYINYFVDGTFLFAFGVPEVEDGTFTPKGQVSMEGDMLTLVSSKLIE